MYGPIRFDEPRECPNCGAEIESVQTKKFEKVLDTYEVGDRIDHAEETRIAGEHTYCSDCSEHIDNFVYLVVDRGILVGVTDTRAVLALIDFLEERGQSSSDRESSENLHLKVDQPVKKDQRGIPRTRKCVVCGEWNHRMATYPPNAESVLGVCDGCVSEIVKEWWRENIGRTENTTAKGPVAVNKRIEHGIKRPKHRSKTRCEKYPVTRLTNSGE